jgi:hypothetical protein
MGRGKRIVKLGEFKFKGLEFLEGTIVFLIGNRRLVKDMVFGVVSAQQCA